LLPEVATAPSGIFPVLIACSWPAHYPQRLRAGG
jgi:hypothetical protein